jgi:septal ring factor EnvC (AmiA/AmiB activator)
MVGEECPEVRGSPADHQAVSSTPKLDGHDEAPPADDGPQAAVQAARHAQPADDAEPSARGARERELASLRAELQAARAEHEAERAAHEAERAQLERERAERWRLEAELARRAVEHATRRLPQADAAAEPAADRPAEPRPQPAAATLARSAPDPRPRGLRRIVGGRRRA